MQTTFMITNNGTGASNVLSLVEVNSTGFSLSNDTCSGSALAPNGTCTFVVNFTDPTCTAFQSFEVNWSVNMQTNGFPYIALRVATLCP
jgi:hypothetical protein